MREKRRKKTSPEAKDTTLEYYYELYLKGVPLDKDKLDLLASNNYIDTPDKKIKSVRKKNVPDPNVVNKSDISKEADSFINIVSEESGDKVVIIASDDAIEDHKKSLVFDPDLEIKQSDWMPKSRIYHERDFVEWIDSINSGFQNMKPYKKFELYKEQARRWMADTSSIEDFVTSQERLDYMLSEFKRCDENSLYWLNKRIWIKEGSMPGGRDKYDAKPVHEVMAYLFDCGYNVEIGKPRQIAATTTVGALAVKRLIYNQNYFIKMIAQDKDKVQEIFDDKIKFPFSELEPWMRPSTFNDRDNILSLKRKKKKGKVSGNNSKIQVVAPSVAAINGGAPDLVLIDEAGYIGVLGKMIKEGRPTLFRHDKKTGQLEMLRQIWIWGTGGEMDKGGKAYETEYYATLDKWKKRDFEYGIIPIFFDWTTRPGMTQEIYEQEKRNYTVDGPDAEVKRIQFRQAYPSIVEDMFLTSQKTLVSIEYINNALERIYKTPSIQPIYGYFEPVYDTSKPLSENQDVPYRVSHATFVEVEITDPRATTIMFMDRKEGVVNTYYQGTDPIAADNGYSKMASTVFDARLGTISCVVNYRDSNHLNAYLQCFLAGLYYGRPNYRIPELIEANIGRAYADYIIGKGYERSLVLRTELPMSLQGGQHNIGVDNKAGRARIIVNMLFELITTYGDKIWIPDFFQQLRTYTCTTTESGNDIWGVSDRKKFQDDVLYSSSFAYICSLCFSHLRPMTTDEASSMRKRVVYKTIREPSGRLRRIPINGK